MPGLVPGIHVFLTTQSKTWMAGSSPAMTEKALNQILLGDDLTQPRVIRNEFLDEFMDAVLEDIVHMLCSSRLRTPRAWRWEAPWRP